MRSNRTNLTETIRDALEEMISVPVVLVRNINIAVENLAKFIEGNPQNTVN